MVCAVCFSIFLWHRSALAIPLAPFSFRGLAHALVQQQPGPQPRLFPLQPYWDLQPLLQAQPLVKQWTRASTCRILALLLQRTMRCCSASSCQTWSSTPGITMIAWSAGCHTLHTQQDLIQCTSKAALEGCKGSSFFPLLCVAFPIKSSHRRWFWSWSYSLQW